MVREFYTIVTEERQVSYKMSLPETLRAEFKSLCALEGVTMNQVLVDLIEQWVGEKKQERREGNVR